MVRSTTSPGKPPVLQGAGALFHSVCILNITEKGQIGDQFGTFSVFDNTKHFPILSTKNYFFLKLKARNSKQIQNIFWLLKSFN